MPENQAKRIGNEGQNHTNFGLIKYPQTYLLLVLEQNNHKQTPKNMHQDISKAFYFLMVNVRNQNEEIKTIMQ